MKLFFRSLIIFFIFLFLFTEIVARVFHLSTDAPKTYKNKNSNVNYFPNQEGYWGGGRHKWYINEMGYPGKKLPESLDSLVLVIGDSYIQNFMNPDSCRQRKYLKKILPKLNFLEVSKDGTNFLGYFEYAKPLDSLKPKLKLIYVSDKDFTGNVNNGKNKKSNYQVNLETGTILYPAYRGSKLKHFIYNFKFLYFMYRKNLKMFSPVEVEANNEEAPQKMNLSFDHNELEGLVTFIKLNYSTDNVILVFHPQSDRKLMSFLKESGFMVMEIQKPIDENWKTENDGHWNCSAHEKIASQVALFLEENSFIN